METKTKTETKIYNFLIDQKDKLNFYSHDYEIEKLLFFFMRLYNNDYSYNEYKEDVEQIKIIKDRIEIELNKYIEDKIIIYTKTGYYRLNDNSASRGYDAAMKADKYIKENLLNIDLKYFETIMKRIYKTEYNIFNCSCLFFDKIFKPYYLNIDSLYKKDKFEILVKKYYKLKFGGKFD